MAWLDFKTWLIDEATFHFGKHQGKDLTDPSIPTFYLRWALDNLNRLKPEFQDELRQEIGRRGSGQSKTTAPKVQTMPTQPVQPSQPPAQQPTAPAQPVWYKAKVIGQMVYHDPEEQEAFGDEFPFEIGDDVAASKQSDGDWLLVSLSTGARTEVPNEDISSVIKGYRDAQNNLVHVDPAELAAAPSAGQSISATQDAPAPTQQGGKLRFLPDEVLDKGAEPGKKTELRRIDDQFKANLDSPKQSNIMISALAGSGKTTALRHLAWKYGRPGQKWLYLVFNTKNRVEAKEDFPPFVDVQTTNSFLGHLLGDPKNVTRLPQTDLMVKMKGGENSKVPDKSAVIADSTEFADHIRKAGIPTGYSESMASRYGLDKYEAAALRGIINSMNYTFKNVSLTLLNLAKSYGVDPRNDKEMNKGIDDIMNRYDLDTKMDDIKERVQKYKPAFGGRIKSILHSILGYNFMNKDYAKEIKNSAIWLLHETMPGATAQKFHMGGVEYDLNQFRDFNDDLWYVATHANNLVWPHYDVVLADEVQDFNEAQKIMLQKLQQAGAKIVAVGDQNQCVIEGSLVTMADGSYKQVELCQVGEHVRAAAGQCSTTTSKITQVYSREVEDIDVVEITTDGGRKVISTPEHTHFAGFREYKQDWHVYLMYRSDLGYRIGLTKNFRLRSNQERADKLWLLRSCPDEGEARFYEHYYSINYGIPTWIFHAEGRGIHYNEHWIKEMFSTVDTVSHAKKLADELGINLDRPHHLPKSMGRPRKNFVITMCGDHRSLSCPLHSYAISGIDWQDARKLEAVGLRPREAKKGVKGWRLESSCAELSTIYDVLDKVRRIIDLEVSEKARFCGKALPYCRASNVLVGMKIFAVDGNGVIEDRVKNVRKVKYSGKVYDLNIGRFHNYVVNDVVTHNSIYRFRGADDQAFGNIGKMLTQSSANKNVVHNLTKNYRSRKAIIDFVNNNTIVNNLKQGKEFKDGGEGAATKYEVGYPDSFNQLQNEKNAGKIKETAYLSRTNEPLVHAALSLLGRGIPFVIVGRDVANDLLKHIGKIAKSAFVRDNDSVQTLKDKMEQHLADEQNKFSTHATKKNYLKELGDVTLALVSAINQFDPNNDPQNPNPQGQQRQTKTVMEFKSWLKAKLGGFDVQEDARDLAAFKAKMEKEHPVVLSTAHKAKGLEFERVYILRNDQWPHPKAKRPEDRVQEENNRYVAYSRPKDEIHVLQLKGQPGYNG